MANLPATQVEQKEVVYTAADGQEIKLTPDMVRKYLVQGKGELVSLQEMIFFLNVCKSRKLNPFIKDCYLIKYSENDPAAVVTSVDYFRKRARAMPDCKGWRSGIIVKSKDGTVRDTAGLIQDDETLLGGWFEAKPEGWHEPLRLEVNLRGYVKKTKEGRETRFWSAENQPSQIQKVAESQGLRKLWPDEFQGIYSEEEITGDDREKAIDIEPDLIAKFDASIPKADPGLINAYLSRIAESNKKNIAEIKAEIAANPKELTNLWKLFPAWCKQQKKAIVEEKGNIPPPIEKLMDGAGIATPEEKKLFWDYCMASGESKELAERMLANFEEYYRAYSRMVDAAAEEEGAE
jgi:phage recombination protein Bet